MLGMWIITLVVLYHSVVRLCSLLISLAECHTVVVIRIGELRCSQLMPKILRSLTKILGLCRKETLGVFAHIHLKTYNEFFKAVQPAQLTELR